MPGVLTLQVLLQWSDTLCELLLFYQSIMQENLGADGGKRCRHPSTDCIPGTSLELAPPFGALACVLVLTSWHLITCLESLVVATVASAFFLKALS